VSAKKSTSVSESAAWTPASWRQFPIKQQPVYTDKVALQKVEQQLKANPSLIYPTEAQQLRKQLALAAEGKAFLLQGGDCAESFAEFSDVNLRSFFRVILENR